MQTRTHTQTHIGWLIILHLYLFSYKALTHTHNFSLFCGIKQWNQNIFIVHPSIHFYYWWCAPSLSLFLPQSFSFMQTQLLILLHQSRAKQSMYKIAKERRHTRNVRKKSTSKRDVRFELSASIIVVFDKSLNAHCMAVYGFNEACDLGIIRFDETVRFCDENS